MLSSQPYYDTQMQSYYNIVTTNMIPPGPLARFVRRISTPNMRPYQINMDSWNSPQRNQCIYAFMSLNRAVCTMNRSTNLMCVDEVPNLFSFLISNGYTIDTKITKMMTGTNIRFNTGDILAFVSYANIRHM
jgi:hypothetical protein